MSAVEIMFGSPDETLRVIEAAWDHFNTLLGAGEVDVAASGGLLVRLERIGAKETAAQAGVLRRFDAADAHDTDGYGSSAAWLAARAGMTKKAAKAAVRQMRELTGRPRLDDALAAGEISGSLAFTIAGWTRKLPAQMRDETDEILLEALSGGVSQEGLASVAGLAMERWRQQQPDPDDPDDRFGDRFLRLDKTFGGAAVLRGDLTPECAETVGAVLDALGKRAGPEDDRSEAQRFHDALQLACTLLLRAKLVPDRAGADTQATVVIPISQLRAMPGAAELEDAWIRARLGEDGYLTGPDAQAAACDALIVPVVTGTTDPAIVDEMINLARTAAAAEPPGAGPGDPEGGNQPRSQLLSPEAWQALRYTMTRLAIDLVSGPAGIAAVLRRGLLEQPFNTPGQLLDIGYSKSIPGHIRRAVLLRDRHCAFPQCDRPAAHCDVHHLRHQADGGPTSLDNCVLLCQFHHDVCVHRKGWTLIRHPDGTIEARSPDGYQIHRSHAPPGISAA